jgi:hypothetical protein
VLQRHLGDSARLISNGASKADDGANVGAARSERGDLGADIEILFLNADHISLL